MNPADNPQTSLPTVFLRCNHVMATMWAIEVPLVTLQSAVKLMKEYHVEDPVRTDVVEEAVRITRAYDMSRSAPTVSLNREEKYLLEDLADGICIIAADALQRKQIPIAFYEKPPEWSAELTFAVHMTTRVVPNAADGLPSTRLSCRGFHGSRVFTL